MTTGSCDPFAYMNEAEAVRSRAKARSSWTLFCHVCATWNSGSTVHGDCTGRTPVPAAAGNAGAPAWVPLKVYAGALGEPDSCKACSYAPSSAWSYMTPVLARSTVRGFSVQATPARGPKLFLSILKFCDDASGAAGSPLG